MSLTSCTSERFLIPSTTPQVTLASIHLPHIAPISCVSQQIIKLLRGLGPTPLLGDYSTKQEDEKISISAADAVSQPAASVLPAKRLCDNDPAPTAALADAVASAPAAAPPSAHDAAQSSNEVVPQHDARREHKKSKKKKHRKVDDSPVEPKFEAEIPLNTNESQPKAASPPPGPWIPSTYPIPPLSSSDHSNNPIPASSSVANAVPPNDLPQQLGKRQSKPNHSMLKVQTPLEREPPPSHCTCRPALL